MMNKRVLRKFAIPSSSPNPKNGIFCADQVKYVVRTAIKNIDHQRTLVRNSLPHTERPLITPPVIIPCVR